MTAITAIASAARAESEIVIAIRYLQAEGTSHSHLYLYREDGKFLRQLTNDSSSQDIDPIFAPDGAAIVFIREKPHDVREFWRIDPRGTGLKELDGPPDWYTQTKSSPCFTNIEPEESTSPSPAASPEESASPAETSPPSYKSPDNSVELILREDKNDPDEINVEGHGKHYLLRDLKTGTETEFGELPGFIGVFELLHDRQEKDPYFLFQGPLRLAFFDLHLNSTDGIPLPSEAAFLTFTENRYVSIPDTKKTANCSYVERWDEKLNNIRYARERSAAICYGMSMYRPGEDPAVITMRRSAD